MGFADFWKSFGGAINRDVQQSSGGWGNLASGMAQGVQDKFTGVSPEERFAIDQRRAEFEAELERQEAIRRQQENEHRDLQAQRAIQNKFNEARIDLTRWNYEAADEDRDAKFEYEKTQDEMKAVKAAAIQAERNSQTFLDEAEKFGVESAAARAAQRGYSPTEQDLIDGQVVADRGQRERVTANTKDTLSIKRTQQMLGMGVDPDDPEAEAKLDFLMKERAAIEKARAELGPKQMAQMQADGLPVPEFNPWRAIREYDKLRGAAGYGREPVKGDHSFEGFMDFQGAPNSSPAPTSQKEEFDQIREQSRREHEQSLRDPGASNNEYEEAQARENEKVADEMRDGLRPQSGSGNPALGMDGEVSTADDPSKGKAMTLAENSTLTQQEAADVEEARSLMLRAKDGDTDAMAEAAQIMRLLQSGNLNASPELVRELSKIFAQLEEE